MTVQEGALLCGRYRLQRSIGRGGMADVFMAFDKKRQAPVAVKILREDMAEEPDLVRRFGHEAQALARLDHPNIVHFYAFEQDGPVAFIVMDYIEGTTLRGLLNVRRKPLDVKEITSILRDLCSALHYAHLNGFIHRDLKPGNIMLKQDGKALLTDFGISRATEGVTLTGEVVGTPAYMSPEQVAGGQVDARSDIYSLGALLFEMATGRRPFTGEEPGLTRTGTNTRIQEAHLRLTPPDPRVFNGRLPPAAAKVILRALAKQPADRWPDVVILRQAWEAAVGATSAFDDADAPARDVSPLGKITPVQPPAQRPSFPRWALILIGLAILAVTAALVIASLMPGEETAVRQVAVQPTSMTTASAPSEQTPAARATHRPTTTGGVVRVATAAPAASEPGSTAPMATPAQSNAIQAPSGTVPHGKSAVETLTLSGEPTMIPTRMAEPTPTPVIPTRTPAPTPRPPQPTPSSRSSPVSPGGVLLLSPLPGSIINQNNAVMFEWQDTGGFELKTGEQYELIFWKPEQSAMQDGVSPVAAAANTKVQVNLAEADSAPGFFGQNFERGEWFWGIALRNGNNVRSRLLSESRLLIYEPPSGDNRNDDPGCTGPSCR